MSRLEEKDVSLLYYNYKKFCKSVTYRESEDFYSESNSVLELSYNENPLGAGELAKKALRYHSEYGHLYPPLAYSKLTEKLANRLNVTNENLIITAGSVTAIYLAVQQYAEPGDKVIFSKSSLPWYRWSTIVNKSTPIMIPLLPDMNHDLDGIFKAIDKKTKVIILSNPHNPTGLYINESELKSFFDKVPEDILVIIDQAYYEYQSNQEKILIELINKVPNLMLTRTFSKLHGLAGMRIGYGITNPQFIKELKAKWLAFMPAITSAGTFAAYHALDDEEHYHRSRKFNNNTKHELYKLCEDYDVDILSSEANFVAINIKDSVKNEKQFFEQGFRFTAGYFFGYPDWARISFISNINKLYESIRKIILKIN
jgi:histidinol-phosphate aminotransferase